MPAAIRTEGLTKYYGRVVGLEGLTLEVPEGGVFGFLGPNGAGKTTTIRLLLDLIRPTAGSAWIAGVDCRKQSLEARKHVGYLPGELPFYPELTGHRFLSFLAAIGHRPVLAGWLERLLRRFDVSETDLRRKMRDYSHGMKRKLGVIQALMTDPPVVVLDEPTGGLDPLMIEAFVETVHELKQRGRTTVFMSSHVLAEVERTCDCIGLVRRGRLAAIRTMGDIRAELPKRVTVELTAAIDRPLPRVEGTTLVLKSGSTCVFDVRGPIGPLLMAIRDLPVHDLRVEPFELEQYVLGFYTGQDGV